MINRRFYVVLLSILLLPVALWSAESNYVGQFSLDEIVIEDSRPQIEDSSRLRVIPAKEIEERGVKTLDRVLEMVPGINVRVGAGGVPRIDMRGLRSRHVTLLLDGIPLNSTFDGQMDPRVIPVEIIKKVKISFGTGSVLYGSGGLGGVINIITKRGVKGKDKFFLQHEIGKRTQQNSVMRVSGSNGDFDYFLGLNNEIRDGFELSDNFTKTNAEDGGRRENSDLSRKSLFLKIGLTPSDRWQWGVTVGHQVAEFGYPQLTVNNKADIFANKIKYERADDIDGRFFQVSTSYDAPGPWEMKLWYFYNRLAEETNGYDDENYIGMTNPKVKNTYHQDSKTLISGECFQAIRTMGDDSSLTFSLKSKRSDYRAEGQIRDVKVKVAGKTNYNVRQYESNRTLRNQSVAAEYNFKLTNLISGNVGLSLNKQKSENRSDQTKNEFNVGFSKEISEKTNVHLAVASKIRFPAIRQLYDEKSGNTNLDPESSMNYELGLTHKFCKRTNGSLTIFQNNVKDYIEKNNTTNLYENFQKYRFKGVELAIRHSCNEPLLLESSLTLMDSKEIDSKVGRDELQFRPKVKFTAAATYNAKNKLQAHIEFLHIDGQNFYSKNAPYVQGTLNEINVTNLKVSKPIRYDSFTIYAGIDNVFDRNYETGYGVPAQGRYWYLGIQTKM